MTIDATAKRLHARMQLAANEALAALADTDRAQAYARFYENDAWQRRMQKCVARILRAQARLDEARAAYEEHHEATCESCQINRAAGAMARDVVEDYQELGQLPTEERN